MNSTQPTDHSMICGHFIKTDKEWNVCYSAFSKKNWRIEGLSKMLSVHNNVARENVNFCYFFCSTFVHCFCSNFMFLSLFLSFSLVTVRAFRESMRQCEQRGTVHPSFLRSDYASMTVTRPNPVQSSLTATQERRRQGHTWTGLVVQTMRLSTNLKERSRVDTWEYRDRFKSIYEIATLSPYM